MKKDNTKLIEIILLTMVVILIITAVVGVFQLITNNNPNEGKSNNQQSLNQQLKNPNVNVDIPSPIITLSSGEDGEVINVGTVLNITCQGNSSYSCNIVIKSNSSTQTINFPSQAIVDNGKGQSLTSWQWIAIGGKWTLTSSLSNSEGQSSLSPSVILNVN